MTTTIIAVLVVLAWAAFALARWLDKRAEEADDAGGKMVRAKFKVASVMQMGKTCTVQLEYVESGDEDADVHGGTATLVVPIGAGQGMFAPGREVVIEVLQAD